MCEKKKIWRAELVPGKWECAASATPPVEAEDWVSINTLSRQDAGKDWRLMNNSAVDVVWNVDPCEDIQPEREKKNRVHH